MPNFNKASSYSDLFSLTSQYIDNYVIMSTKSPYNSQPKDNTQGRI